MYLRWHLVHGSAPYLGKAFVDENWNFYSHTLLGAKAATASLASLRARCRSRPRNGLGQAYVAAAFPPESKQRTVAMVHDIEHAMDQDITSIDWMQPVTKEQAKIKLHAIDDKIGYPDHWRDYSSVKDRSQQLSEQCSRGDGVRVSPPTGQDWEARRPRGVDA